MKNKREFTRVNREINCVLFFKGNEYNGVINNISNNGLGITVDCNIKDLTEKKDIRILFNDKLNWNDKSYFMDAETVIVWKSKIENNKTFIGVKIKHTADNEENFMKYVDDLKVQNFVRAIR